MKERDDSLSKLVGWLLEVPPNESISVPRGSLRQRQSCDGLPYATNMYVDKMPVLLRIFDFVVILIWSSCSVVAYRDSLRPRM